MKPLLKIVSVWLLIGLATPMAAFSTELTLDDCIELALKNRASIIASLGGEKLASAEKRAALGAFMPRLSAGYNYSKSKQTDIKFDQQDYDITLDTFWVADAQGGATDAGLVVPQSTPAGIVEMEAPDQDRTNKSLNFTASMSLFEPANWFQYAAAGADRERARLNILATEQDMIYSVKLAYFAYLATAENVSVQEEAVKRAEEQLKLAESRFELGSASKSDVLKQKVQHGNDRLALLKAQNAVINSNATLAYTIGVDPRQDWQFATEYSTREYAGTLEEAVDFGLRHKPSLLAAAKSVDAARAGVRAAKMDYLPTLSGYAQLNYSDGTRGDTVAFNQSSTSQTFGLTVSYNIFDGFFRENRVSQAKVSFNNRRAELADFRNAAVGNIKTAYLDIEQLREQKQVSEENVNAADEDLKIQQEKYRLGAATILDLLDAQVSLKMAQVSLIQADFDLNLAMARLENAMGKM